MFVINGTDYTLIVIGLAIGLTLAGLQYLLCRKAKHFPLKLIPSVVVAVPFVLALICFIEDGGGGFIDLSDFFAAIFAVVGCVWGLMIGVAWLAARHRAQ